MTQLYILFLGTGGSWPTATRNVSSIALKRGGEIILFDCGEGTQRQFQKSIFSYMQISKIFITHFHGDHFLGLPGLIQTMQLNDRAETLHVYGPRGLKNLMKQLLSLGYFNPTFEIAPHEIDEGEKIDFREYTIEPFRVEHGVPTLGYKFEEKMRPGRFNKARALKLGVPEGPLFGKLQRGEEIKLENNKVIKPDMVLGPLRKGRKIIFSGDTVPCEKTVKFSKDADVLIHEATFDSTMEETANSYGHSTAQQAAKIAEKSEVKKLFLVHISPRYLNYRVLLKEAKKFFKNTYVPKDLQQFEVKYRD